MKVVFFRIPKPKRFAYPPRYYDEEKERREQRKKELGISPTGEKLDFESNIRANWKRFKKVDKQRQQKAKMSVMIYLIIAALLIYFVFFA